MSNGPRPLTCAPASTCPTNRSAHTSAMRINNALLFSGYLYSQLLLFSNVLLPPPSTIYAINVHGAPTNPMSGTRPSSPRRVSVSASNRYPSSLSTSTSVRRRARCDGSTRGSGSTGPLDGSIRTVMPSACGMTRMSQKMILASRAVYRSIGWSVRAEAMLGVWQHSKNECSFRTARNSGVSGGLAGVRAWDSGIRRSCRGRVPLRGEQRDGMER